jgi:mono/diheme cytochrome c family protein
MVNARWTSMAVAAGIFMLALAPGIEAQKIKNEPIQRIDSISGAATFKAYCTVCHGIGGKGDGPAAKALKVPPADLTKIAARHNGKFPATAVKMTIRGEADLPAHGTREMPMWGMAFRSIDDASTTELRLANLVSYIEAMQQKQ